MAFIPIFPRRAGVPTLMRAASPLSTNLAASHWKPCDADVGCGAGSHPAADFQSAHAPTLATRFVAPETFPPGIDSRSWRWLRIPGSKRQRHERWRHNPSAMPNRMVVDSGGARTPADTQLSGSPEASARVPTRHAGVRAPLQIPRFCNGLRRGLWRVPVTENPVCTEVQTGLFWITGFRRLSRTVDVALRWYPATLQCPQYLIHSRPLLNSILLHSKRLSSGFFAAPQRIGQVLENFLSAQRRTPE